MENHPIPQDVTGFKFKLIGSMTVKQFLYLLFPGIIAVVIFLINAIPLFARIPLMIFVVGIGATFAFVPIEGRPMDMMIANFFRAVFTQSQYAYRKQGVNLASYPAFDFAQQQVAAVQSARSAQDDRKRLIASALRNSSFRPDTQELAQINQINAAFGNSVGGVQSPPPVQTASQAPAQTTSPSTTIHPLPTHEETEMPAQPPVQNASRQQGSASKQAPEPSVQEKTPTNKMASTPAINEPERVSAPRQSAPVAADTQASAQSQAPQPFSSLPDMGNIVLGAVSDARGKPLLNILVEVKSAQSQGEALRTFKTNSEGKFSAATPMPDGTYTVSFEDTKGAHRFEDVQISLDGSIFQPLIVTSVDDREDLRKELFGN